MFIIQFPCFRWTWSIVQTLLLASYTILTHIVLGFITPVMKLWYIEEEQETPVSQKYMTTVTSLAATCADLPIWAWQCLSAWPDNTNYWANTSFIQQLQQTCIVTISDVMPNKRVSILPIELLADIATAFLYHSAVNLLRRPMHLTQIKNSVIQVPDDCLESYETVFV